MWIDNDFPKLRRALSSPPAYIIEMATEPVVVHDCKQPGQTVQLDRYRFAVGTKIP